VLPIEKPKLALFEMNKNSVIPNILKRRDMKKNDHDDAESSEESIKISENDDQVNEGVDLEEKY